MVYLTVLVTKLYRPMTFETTMSANDRDSGSIFDQYSECDDERDSLNQEQESKRTRAVYRVVILLDSRLQGYLVSHCKDILQNLILFKIMSYGENNFFIY